MPTQLTLRDATRADVPAIVAMLADDMLGAAREDTSEPLSPDYYVAFEDIERDPFSRLLIAEIDGEVVGTLQFTILPGLSHRGARRALIEAVRVTGAHRGKGIGQEIVRQVIELARAENCKMVQLSSNKSRTDAHRFYEGLGFEASHVGMKLSLK